MKLAYSTSFDNRSLKRLVRGSRSRTHLKFELAGKTFGYTHIRKNGSSLFKELLGYARHTNISEIMARHALPPREPVDHLIFVYRDPVARMKSLFQNKFVDKDENKDIARRYAAAMDDAPITFSNFLTFAEKGLDPHCWTQASHLLLRKYTNAIELKDLFAAMAELVGEEQAGAFRRKLNASTPQKFDVCEKDIERIRQIYREDYAMIATINARRAEI